MASQKKPEPPSFDDAVVVEVNCTTGLQTERPATAREKASRKRSWKEGQAQRVGEARATRNRLLAASDWTQLPDVDLSETKRVAWSEYRQALRDMKFGKDPAAIEFPVSPEGTT